MFGFLNNRSPKYLICLRVTVGFAGTMKAGAELSSTRAFALYDSTAFWAMSPPRDSPITTSGETDLATARASSTKSYIETDPRSDTGFESYRPLHVGT